MHRWVAQVEGWPFYPAKTFFLSYKAGPDRQPIHWYTRNQKALGSFGTLFWKTSIFNWVTWWWPSVVTNIFVSYHADNFVLSASDATKYFHCVRILILARSKDLETVWGHLFLRLDWNDESKKQRRDDKHKNKTQQSVFRVSFAFVCCLLHCTFSRGTQNSRA